MYALSENCVYGSENRADSSGAGCVGSTPIGHTIVYLGFSKYLKPFFVALLFALVLVFIFLL